MKEALPSSLIEDEPECLDEAVLTDVTARVLFPLGAVVRTAELKASDAVTRDVPGGWLIGRPSAPALPAHSAKWLIGRPSSPTAR